jgi:hypothetical protein
VRDVFDLLCWKREGIELTNVEMLFACRLVKEESRRRARCSRGLKGTLVSRKFIRYCVVASSKLEEITPSSSRVNTSTERAIVGTGLKTDPSRKAINKDRFELSH